MPNLTTAELSKLERDINWLWWLNEKVIEYNNIFTDVALGLVFVLFAVKTLFLLLLIPSGGIAFFALGVLLTIDFGVLLGLTVIPIACLALKRFLEDFRKWIHEVEEEKEENKNSKKIIWWKNSSYSKVAYFWKTICETNTIKLFCKLVIHFLTPKDRESADFGFVSELLVTQEKHDGLGGSEENFAKYEKAEQKKSEKTLKYTKDSICNWVIIIALLAILSVVVLGILSNPFIAPHLGLTILTTAIASSIIGVILNAGFIVGNFLILCALVGFSLPIGESKQKCNQWVMFEKKDDLSDFQKKEKEKKPMQNLKKDFWKDLKNLLERHKSKLIFIAVMVGVSIFCMLIPIIFIPFGVPSFAIVLTICATIAFFAALGILILCREMDDKGWLSNFLKNHRDKLILVFMVGVMTAALLLPAILALCGVSPISPAFIVITALAIIPLAVLGAVFFYRSIARYVEPQPPDVAEIYDIMRDLNVEKVSRAPDGQLIYNNLEDAKDLENDSAEVQSVGDKETYNSIKNQNLSQEQVSRLLFFMSRNGIGEISKKMPVKNSSENSKTTKDSHFTLNFSAAAGLPAG